jgi:glycosyltransferase involved in cell wall biosynthesis
LQVSGPCEVVIDARWLRTGIGRYILTLLQELKPNLPHTLLTCITMPAHVQAVAPLCDQVIEMDCGIYSLMEQARLPLVARSASVFCAPHYNIPVFRTGPLVVTIHDLTHLIFPAYRSRLRTRLYAEPMLRLACARAAQVVTPSRYTREMLIDRLGANPDKVSVVPCAVDAAFRPQVKSGAMKVVQERHGVSTPYILFVGSTAPHKNLITLLIAYQYLYAKRRDMPPLLLVLPGQAKKSQADARLLQLMTMPGVRCLRGVADDALASLYSAALMTIVPSCEEGFGLPVIESMACGSPVLCSRAASLPEIAGDSAIYFEPASGESIASGIEQLLDSDDLRQKFSMQGLERAGEYSASRAAAGYASVLSSAIAGGGS